jgi:ribosomal protein S18 acetylase RimI-like enzyme
LFERLLMTRDASTPLPPGRASANPGFRFEPWCDRHCDQAAAVLSFAYSGHIDCQINDQYRTFAGAVRYLYDLVQFPGSATFCRSASYVAFDMTTGQPAGISLASFVADDVAHITELCVTPRVRGAGLGYELLRQSAEALRGAGANRISLAVTAANEEAIGLYKRCGFRGTRRFHAYVWER